MIAHKVCVALMVLIFIVALTSLPTVDAGTSKNADGDFVLSNSQANFTIDANTGLIIGILDKSSGRQLIRYSNKCGFILNNGSWILGVNEPFNGSASILVNDTTRVVSRQDVRGTGFNLTYDYRVYDNRLDIDTQLLRTNIAEINLSAYHYYCGFDLSDLNLTPVNGATQYLKGVTSSDWNYLYRLSLGIYSSSIDYAYLFNKLVGFLLAVQTPQAVLVEPGDDLEDRFFLSDGSNFKFKTSEWLLKQGDTVNISFTMVVSKRMQAAKLDAWNIATTGPSTDSSLSGNWWSWDVNGQGSSVIPDAYISLAKNNHVKWVQYGGWDNNQYPFYHSAGSWTIPTTGSPISYANVTKSINLLKHNGFAVFLHFNFIERNASWAQTYFPKDIVVNKTGGYPRAWPGFVYMAFDNASSWASNVTQTFTDLVIAYPNVTGFFIDVTHVAFNDYNCSIPTHLMPSSKKLVCSSFEHYLRVLKNISQTVHLKGKEVIFNFPRNTNLVQYADAIAIDTSYGGQAARMKINNLGKNVYYYPIGSDAIPTVVNESILFGYFLGFGPYFGNGNISSLEHGDDIFYLINMTANAEFVSYEPILAGTVADIPYVEYAQLLASIRDFSYNAAGSYDFYFVNNHSLIEKDTNRLDWHFSSSRIGSITNVIWFGHFGSYNLTEGQGLAKAFNSSGHEIDGRVPVWIMAGSTNFTKFIASNLSSIINATVTFEVRNCTAGIISYTSVSGTNKHSWNNGNYPCHDNLATLQVNGIEPSEFGNILNISYSNSILAYCGDSVCNNNETCSSCSQDCGNCPVCGDNVCNNNENCNSCSHDCGVCQGGSSGGGGGGGIIRKKPTNSSTNSSRETTNLSQEQTKNVTVNKNVTITQNLLTEPAPTKEEPKPIQKTINLGNLKTWQNTAIAANVSLIILSIFVFHGLKKKPVKNVYHSQAYLQELNKKHQELKDWVRIARDHNIPDGRIMHVLKERGWQESMIWDALRNEPTHVDSSDYLQRLQVK